MLGREKKTRSWILERKIVLSSVLMFYATTCHNVDKFSLKLHMWMNSIILATSGCDIETTGHLV